MSTLVFSHEFTNFWTSSKALSEIDSTDFFDFVGAICVINSFNNIDDHSQMV